MEIVAFLGCVCHTYSVYLYLLYGDFMNSNIERWRFLENG